MIARRLLGTALLALAASLAGCAAAPLAEIAPGGMLRAAINYGNPLLARPGAGNLPIGVSVDLALEAGRQLGVPVALITFDSAGAVAKAIRDRSVDMAFMALDAQRTADAEFSPAYVEIEGAYLVPEDSPLQRIADVDREGVRIAVARGSTYDLVLGRTLKAARLVHVAESGALADTLMAEKLDAAIGVRQQMEADARRLPGLRVLPGGVVQVQQAIALPKGRGASLRWLAGFVEQAKAIGFVEDALKRHGIVGAEVAPPAR